MLSVKIVVRNNIVVERLSRIFDLFQFQVTDKKGDVYFGLVSEEHYLKLKSRPEFLSVEEFKKEESVKDVVDQTLTNVVENSQLKSIQLPKPGSKEYIRMIKESMKK